MSNQENKTFIKKHLGHELELLLTAYELWKYLNEVEAGMVVNIARDSVCVHYRTLVKFFIANHDGHDRAITSFGIDEPYREFAPNRVWIGVIDKAILHIPSERGSAEREPEGDLNNKMEDFADEILALWQRFINKSDEYRAALEEARDIAVAQSKNTYRTLRQRQSSKPDKVIYR